MAITVKHTKVSTVPDSADTSLVRPSDWNADHTLTGLGTMAEQNANNVTITGGSISGTTVSGYIPTSAEGVPNGVATLDAGGKVPTSQIPLQGDLNYQGAWNASTNSPTLTSSVGTQGYYYVVSVAGTTNLNGITDWQIGDWAIFNGSVWQKVDNTDAVTSVNGQIGTVVLTTSDIAEGTNLYYTDARARNALSAGTGISYANSTGVITNSAPDQVVSLTGAGTTTISGTYPNFTITSTDAYTGDVVGPSSATDNAIARFDTTTGKLIQNSAVTIDDAGNIISPDSIQFSGTVPATQPIGTLWFDSSTDTLNLQQNAITQQIGEEIYVYGKASNTISGETLLQAIVKTGSVGASGVIQFGVAGAGVTDGGVFIGVATEDIATNGFGRITSFGVVHSINTTGSTYGETWADGDDIWYNPVTGGLTKTKPVAPNIKVQIGTVIHAGAGGSGSFQVLLNTGSSLGGTDDNVQLTSPSNGQLLTYDGADSYWRNTSLTAGTGISVFAASNGTLTVTNTAPSSGGTVTSVSGDGSVNGITLTGTVTSSGNLTLGGTLGSIANSQLTNSSITINGSPISLGGSVSVGTVTSVTGTSPISSSGGTTPAISISQANSTTSGYLSSTDWNTFNNKSNTNGTVTSVAASVPSFLSISGSPITTTGTLAISYSGTALPIANGGTNQTAFTAKSGNVAGLVFFDGTSLANDATVTDVGYDTSLNMFQAKNLAVGNGIVCNNRTIGSSFTIPTGYSASSTGPITISSGVTVTVPTGGKWVVL